MTAKHVAFNSGHIRNEAGKLVAFYDENTNELHIDGYTEVFKVRDLVEAMEVVGEKA